jgi:hypothetical protein
MARLAPLPPVSLIIFRSNAAPAVLDRVEMDSPSGTCGVTGISPAGCRPCATPPRVTPCEPSPRTNHAKELEGWWFRPCAIASTKRVLRRAWTVTRLVGSLRFPTQLLAGHAASSKVAKPNQRNVRFSPFGPTSVGPHRRTLRGRMRLVRNLLMLIGFNQIDNVFDGVTALARLRTEMFAVGPQQLFRPADRGFE